MSGLRKRCPILPFDGAQDLGRCWRAGRPAGHHQGSRHPVHHPLDDEGEPDLARLAPMVFKMAISLRFSFTAITRVRRC